MRRGALRRSGPPFLLLLWLPSALGVKFQRGPAGASACRPPLSAFARPPTNAAAPPLGSSNSPRAFPLRVFADCLLCPQRPVTHSAWLTPIHPSGLGTDVTSSAKPSFPALHPEIRLFSVFIGLCSFPSCHVRSDLLLDLYLCALVMSVTMSSLSTRTRVSQPTL